MCYCTTQTLERWTGAPIIIYKVALRWPPLHCFTYYYIPTRINLSNTSLASLSTTAIAKEILRSTAPPPYSSPRPTPNDRVDILHNNIVNARVIFKFETDGRTCHVRMVQVSRRASFFEFRARPSPWFYIIITLLRIKYCSNIVIKYTDTIYDLVDDGRCCRITRMAHNTSWLIT